MTSTSPQTIPHLLDLMAFGIRDALSAARALTRAEQAVLMLDSTTQSTVERLRGAGVTLSPGPFPLATAQNPPAFTKLPHRHGQPTDLVSIGRMLHNCDGAVIGMLVLEQTPVGWNARESLRGLETLAQMIERQLWALSLGPALFADPMLKLATHLHELDNGAISHALSGLLRVMAGMSPSRSETIAMQITGLAQSNHTSLDKRDVALTEQAQQLLETVGIGQMSHTVQVEAAETTDITAMAPKRPEFLHPFAKLRVLEEEFEVAEVEETEQFWFRRAGAGADDWALLANRAADGWQAVTAEIVQSTRDVPMDYARMHMLRRRDIPTDEVAEVYDINGVIWWVREGETGPEARLHGDNWKSIDVDSSLPSRDRAIKALHVLAPSLFDLLSVPARDWVNRMARSVLVSPVMRVAAE